MAEVLITQAQRLLESCQNYLIEPDRLVDALNELIREGVVFSDENRIAIASLYYAELGISNALSKRITASKWTSVKKRSMKRLNEPKRNLRFNMMRLKRGYLPYYD